MIDQVIDSINVQRDRYLEQLKEFLAIPSISALPQHAPDVRRCAEWVSQEMQRIGAMVKPAIEPGDNAFIEIEVCSRNCLHDLCVAGLTRIDYVQSADGFFQAVHPGRRRTERTVAVIDEP